MASTQSKLELLVQAKNSASPTLRQVSSDVQGLDRAAGNMAKGLGGLAAVGGVAGIAALGTAAVSTAVDLSRLAAQATDVEASFETMAANAGESAASMMGGLKEASRGAISDFDLMLAANRAMLLGVAQNTEDMTALMDVARTRSQAMGISTTQAFDDLVLGLGRGSTDLLDNLGISLKAEAVYGQYAESIGRVASQLSDQEKKQALVNAVLRDSAELVKANAAAGDDAASNFERMDAAIANSKVALGELFSPAVVAGATLFTGYLEGQITMLENERRALESAWVAAKNFATGSNDLTSETLEYAKAAGQADAVTHSLTFGLGNAGAAALTMGDGMTAAELKVANLATRLAALKAQSDATSAAMASIQSSALGTLESAASGAVGVMGASGVSGTYGPAKERLDAQIKALQQYGGDLDWVKFKSQELAEEAARPFNVAVEAAREAAKSTSGYADTLSDAEQQAQQAFNSIASAAQSVLQGALNTGVGSADSILEAMGLREDAINEDARRLADVAIKGWDSPWAEYFRTSHPGLFDDMFFGDIKAVAARQLKDFEDGLNPELIDRDRAKERIRRMLIGDRNLSEMARELAEELSGELGVPLQQALAASQGALGIGGGLATAGTEGGQAFSDGATTSLDESNGGGAFVSKWTDQMRASYSLLKTAGADAGKEWSQSFFGAASEHLSPALIDLLANLVTPRVQANMAQTSTLTGSMP